MLTRALGMPSLIEDDLRALGRSAQLVADDRVHALVPALGPPGLHDPRIGNQLDVAARDVALVPGAGAALVGADLGGRTRERGMLTRVGKRPIDLLRRGGEADFLMDWGAHGFV